MRGSYDSNRLAHERIYVKVPLHCLGVHHRAQNAVISSCKPCGVLRRQPAPLRVDVLLTIPGISKQFLPHLSLAPHETRFEFQGTLAVSGFGISTEPKPSPALAFLQTRHRSPPHLSVSNAGEIWVLVLVLVLVVLSVVVLLMLAALAMVVVVA